VTSRCQRCGNEGEGRLCPACQEFTTALEALEMRYLAPDPRHQRLGHRSGPPMVAAETLNAGELQLQRLGRRTNFYGCGSSGVMHCEEL
jgi:hypothetical protein